MSAVMLQHGLASWELSAGIQTSALKKVVARSVSGRGSLALIAGALQSLEIVLPVVLIVEAQLIEGVPGVDAGIVLIIKVETDGVVAHRVDVGDIHLLFAYLQNLLPWTMALNLGGGGEDPEIFCGIAEFAAVVEADLQYAGLLVQMDFGWIGV